jgi:hypothetical protein
MSKLTSTLAAILISLSLLSNNPTVCSAAPPLASGVTDATQAANRPTLNVSNCVLVNLAPTTPALEHPLDGATAIPLSPTVVVTASDPNLTDNNLTVRFYRRVAGDAPAAEFTIALIPDPQNESESYPAVFNAATQWIANNRIANNIVFATTTGDMVNNSSSTTQYGNADAAIDILDNGGVWYSVSPGNHDTEMGTTYYANYFGVSRYTSHLVSNGGWFGGSYDDYNTYSLFSASGNDFILINLKFAPGTAILDWADALLKANPTRRGIVVQHNILNVDNSWNHRTSFIALSDNPNLFLMLCGHMHTRADGAAYRSEPGTDGHTIHIMMADYQDFPNGGNGYLRLLRFSPADDMIYATTYSPTLNSYITTSPDQINLAYDLAGTAAPFTMITEVTGITNGGTASAAWSGLAANTQYEWYVTITDPGGLTTTGPVWSFTTGNAPHRSHPGLLQ